MNLINLIPTPARVIIFVAVLLLLGLGALHLHNRIYDNGFQAAIVIAERERQAMAEANRRAIAAAESRLKGELTKIKIEKERLEDAIDRIEVEADADVDATRLGISAGSVRRIEAVR